MDNPRAFWRMPDEMWAEIEELFRASRPNMRRGHWEHRRLAVDTLLHVLQCDLSFGDIPPCLLSGAALSSFLRRWSDVIAGIPACLTGPHWQSPYIPADVAVAISRLLHVERWTISGAHLLPRLPPPLPALAPPQRADRPLLCGHCGARGTALFRPLTDDGWSCPYCGWYLFDNLGIQRTDGKLPKERVYPIATGKYSGR